MIKGKWRLPGDMVFKDLEVDSTIGKTVVDSAHAANAENRDRMREVGGMLKGILSVAYEQAEALNPAIKRIPF